MAKYTDLRTVAKSYSCALLNLQTSSRVIITKLTNLAQKNIEHAPTIVQLIEEYLSKVRYDIQLPVLYLIDSIAKHIKVPYADLFSLHIVKTYCYVLSSSRHEKRVIALKRLKNTWSNVFSASVLQDLDNHSAEVEPSCQQLLQMERDEIDVKIMETKNEIMLLQQKLQGSAVQYRHRNLLAISARKRLSDSFSEFEDEDESPKRFKPNESPESSTSESPAEFMQ